MKNLPPSEIYERELNYLPYKKSLKAVLEFVCSNAPQGGSLLDLMCGPGYLLNQIKTRREDLSLRGVDLDESYILHAEEKYPGIDFEVGDVLSWSPNKPFGVVLCTGSVHHIPYERQEEFIRRIPSMIAPGGFSIVSDCYIDEYVHETGRKLAAARLGYEYLKETIKNGADEEVIAATIDILHNDVMMREFKTSLKKRLPIFENAFSSVQTHKTWPGKDVDYGDYYTILRK